MSALPLSTAKISGSSALKTQLESTLKANDAGLEFTIQGSDTYKWNGTSFDQISADGAALVYATPTQPVNITDPDPSELATYSASIYSGTAVGITETAVTEDYTDWTPCPGCGCRR